MNFFRRSLGALTPISSIRSGGTTASAAGAVSAGGSTVDPSKHTCTSDSLLVNVGGAWRVRSVDDQPCDAIIPSEDINYVINSGQRIYVGPFAIDLKNTNGQITTLVNPNAIGKDWATWITNAAIARMRAYITARQAAGKPVGPLAQAIANGNQTAVFAIASIPEPQLVGDMQWFYDNGSMGRSSIDPATGQPGVQFPQAVAPKYASGGHMLQPTKLVQAMDVNGFRTTYVQYDGDPNTYQLYTIGDWELALGGTITDFNFLKPANTTEFNRNEDDPPFAKFKHPITGEDWGLWISISAAGGADNATIGQWNTSTDAPLGAVMQIGLGPLPKESWWDSFIDALEWIPTIIGEGLFDIGQWLGQMACDLSKQTSLINQLPKDPATRAEALAALAVFNQACPSPPPINCQDPANAANPKCISTLPAQIPWWQQWYVVVPALALVGFGIFKVIGGEKKSQPAA